jgi:methylenetetrahydrofolate dehydrogenase (NADP+)/methenyltetrahydrofolate cyclohydrolase
MLLLEGKTAGAAVKQNLKQKVSASIEKGSRPPHLAAILVGNDGASETYVASKVKNCAEVGFISTLVRFENTIRQDILLNKIKDLNNDDTVDGILVQLPLPKHIDAEAVIKTINPGKDVDGFHPLNAGLLSLGKPRFISATPLGIIMLMAHYNIETNGKSIVIIGRSNIVGRPLSILLSSQAPYGNATVTLCHSQTTDIPAVCKSADIVIAALGRPGFVTAEMIKPGTVVIDVGITRVADSESARGFRIKGDVDFDNVAPLCSAITPVPGGVGLMTISGLLSNTWQAYENNMHGK